MPLRRRAMAALGLLATWQLSSLAFASLGAGRGPAAPAALRGTAVAKLPSEGSEAGWASVALPALGLAAGAALGAGRRSARVSLKAGSRSRFAWKYGGVGSPKTPEWLTSPPPDGRGARPAPNPPARPQPPRGIRPPQGSVRARKGLGDVEMEPARGSG